jgi:hypothetical protein
MKYNWQNSLFCIKYIQKRVFLCMDILKGL